MNQPAPGYYQQPPAPPEQYQQPGQPTWPPAPPQQYAAPAPPAAPPQAYYQQPPAPPAAPPQAYYQQPPPQQGPPPPPAAPAGPPPTLNDFFSQPQTGAGKSLSEFFGGRIGQELYFTVIGAPWVEQDTEMGTNRPATWRDGSPKLVMKLPVQLLTPHPAYQDSKGTWWIKGQTVTELARAMAEAQVPEEVKVAEIGCTIRLALVSKRPVKGMSDANVWGITYWRPQNAANGQAPAQPATEVAQQPVYTQPIAPQAPQVAPGQPGPAPSPEYVAQQTAYAQQAQQAALSQPVYTQPIAPQSPPMPPAADPQYAQQAQAAPPAQLPGLPPQMPPAPPLPAGAPGNPINPGQAVAAATQAGVAAAQAAAPQNQVPPQGQQLPPQASPETAAILNRLGAGQGYPAPPAAPQQ